MPTLNDSNFANRTNEKFATSAEINVAFGVVGPTGSMTAPDTAGRNFGAGEGNRTLVTCLGSKSSAIELRPRWGFHNPDLRTCRAARMMGSSQEAQ
jgi:hypothetical protein